MSNLKTLLRINSNFTPFVTLLTSKLIKFHSRNIPTPPNPPFNRIPSTHRSKLPQPIARPITQTIRKNPSKSRGATARQPVSSKRVTLHIHTCIQSLWEPTRDRDCVRNRKETWTRIRYAAMAEEGFSLKTDALQVGGAQARNFSNRVSHRVYPVFPWAISGTVHWHAE